MWENRIVGMTLDDPDQLLANPLNPRRHPGVQRDVLRDVLDEVGWIAPVIVNDRTGYMIDGHCRVEEALSAGEKIPVLHVDLSEEEETLILATFDPISAMARYDREALDDLLAVVETGSEALQGLLDSLAVTAPEMPTIDDEDVSIFGDDTEFRTLLLLYSETRFDEVRSMLDQLPGGNDAEKVYQAIMAAVVAG